METDQLMEEIDWESLDRQDDGDLSFVDSDTEAVFSLVDVSEMEGMMGDVEGYYWSLSLDGIEYYEEMGETMAKWDTEDEAIEALRDAVGNSRDIWDMI